MPILIRTGGGASGGGLPQFSYTGTYTLIDDGAKNWRIKFLTSGTFIPAKDMTIDVFCVGGGAGGSSDVQHSKGGGGGYTQTVGSVVLQKNMEYPVLIGAGGATGTSGGETAAFGCTVSGGLGANGGSGGGAHSTSTSTGGSVYEGQPGGFDGSDGAAVPSGFNGGTPGVGQGVTTREFGEVTGDLYAGGGGGSARNGWGGEGGQGGGGTGYGRNGVTMAIAGSPNTGGGGGGYYNNASLGGAGGSGIVVIRNHREVAA